MASSHAYEINHGRGGDECHGIAYDKLFDTIVFLSFSLDIHLITIIMSYFLLYFFLSHSVLFLASKTNKFVFFQYTGKNNFILIAHTTKNQVSKMNPFA
jgi:hypothetical protein